jgi:hypothetical protein
MTTTRAIHEIRICETDGSAYAYCRLCCGWAGPWRRWTWRARWDGRCHLVTMSELIP